MRIHHYGLATNNLDQAMEAFRSLGYQVNEPVLDPIQRVKVALASREGEHPIELVCDDEGGGQVRGILSKSGSGLYHICYEVDQLEETIATLRAKGYLLLHKPTPATAFDKRRIAWLYNRNIGLIELLESKCNSGNES